MKKGSIPGLQISKIYIATKGDRDVGLVGENVTISADGDFIIDLENIEDEHRRDAVESLRTKLENAFSELWGEKATARYDFELAAE